jgi:GNAT superfamily N-acetyltransferase
MTRPSECGREILVNMVREDLEDIPDHPLLFPFSVRWYQPGDENLWLDIEARADDTLTFTRQMYFSEFGLRPHRLAERQCFLFDRNGASIGTATAWFDKDYHGLPYGRVHWVAIVPEMQGHGLAKPLMTIVCKRLRDLGHARATLLTSTARIPAINLYLKFGFSPEIHTDEDLDVWHELRAKLREPLDLSRYSNSG